MKDGDYLAAAIAGLFTFYHYLTMRELRKIYRRIADALDRMADQSSAQPGAQEANEHKGSQGGH